MASFLDVCCRSTIDRRSCKVVGDDACQRSAVPQSSASTLTAIDCILRAQWLVNFGLPRRHFQAGCDAIVLAWDRRFSPKTREPRNNPNTRKQGVTVQGFPSVCSVYSVVKKSESGDHRLVLVPENQGTTEQPEYTETRHNRARIPFRVFCVFRGLKNVPVQRPRIGSCPRKPGNHRTT